MSSRPRAYLFLLGTVVIWGIAAPIAKHTLGFTDPLTLLVYRFTLTSLVLVPWFLSSAKRRKSLTSLPLTSLAWLFITSLLGSTIQLGLLFWGVSLTTSIHASVINATSSLWVGLFGVWFLKETMTKKELSGLLLAFLGVLVIVFQPDLIFFDHSGQMLVGNLLVLVAAVSWAGCAIITKRLLKARVSPHLLTVSLFFVGAITLWPIYLSSNPTSIISHLISLPLAAHLGIWFLAFFSGSLAYWLYQQGARLIEISEADAFQYLVPLVATPVGALWLGEKITLPFLIGSIIIATGVFLVESRRKRR